MLEKIGLPAKPFLKGNSWVVDASHCQGCASQFTLFNRKHHCRRCGGLFCNSCTSQRMYLRGQGDASVRVCEPCKQLEDAARLEARMAHKNRRGVAKHAISEKEVTEIISGTGSKSRASSSSNAMPGNLHGIGLENDDNREPNILPRSTSNVPINSPDDSDSVTPDQLYQQAHEEKRKYYSLKKERKDAEALQAFKRHKELERRARALELFIRKNQRECTKNALPDMEQNQENHEDAEMMVLETSVSGKQMEARSTHKRKESKRDERKDDISSELKELGWSDADLHHTDEKPRQVTLEGELFELLGNNRKSKSVNEADQAQVLAHKRRALALKREGKVAEAKEELKKAKILEKEIEEKMIFGEDEESDDELASLIRGLENEANIKDKPLTDFNTAFTGASAFDMSTIMTIDEANADDIGIDVTDADLIDSDITTALKSMGWEEDFSEECAADIDIENMQQNVLKLKKEAVSLKRAGNLSEAKERLQQAKALERDLHDMQLKNSVQTPNIRKPASNVSPLEISSMKLDDNNNDVEVEDEDMENPDLLEALKNMGWKDDDIPLASNQVDGKKKPSSSKVGTVPTIRKSKAEIQRELLGIKRNALAHRRAGCIEEAETELSKAKVLEKQLEDMEKVKPVESKLVSGRVIGKNLSVPPKNTTLINDEEYESVEVTEDDMNDPDLINALKEMGLQEDNEPELPSKVPASQPVSNVTSKTFKTKAQIQRELLAIKRKALTLRREGRYEEADAELKKGNLLEEHLRELEVSETSQEPKTTSLINNDMVNSENAHSGKRNIATELPKFSSKAQIQKDLLAIKRHALALRRQGLVHEADAELSKGKLLEEQLEAMEKTQINEASSDISLQVSRPDDFGTIEKISFESGGVPSRAANQELTDLMIPLSAPAKTPESLGEKPNHHHDPNDDVENTINLSTISKDQVVLQTKIDESTDTLLGFEFGPEVSHKENEVAGKKPVTEVFDLLSGDNWNPCSSDSGERSLVSIKRYGTSFAEGEAINVEHTIEHDKHLQSIKDSSLPSSEKLQNETLSSTQSADNLPASSDLSQQSLHLEILSHKRKAVALKKEGKLAEAKEQLRLAKLLEKKKESLQGDILNDQQAHSFAATNPEDTTTIQRKKNQYQQNDVPAMQYSEEDARFEGASSSTGMVLSTEGNQQIASTKRSQIPKQLTSRDRIKLQREALAHKKRALALKREGKLDEYEATLEKAKSLESQLDEHSGNTSQAGDMFANVDNDVNGALDDIFDPQLVSALKGLGWQDSDILGGMSSKSVNPTSKGSVSMPGVKGSSVEHNISSDFVKKADIAKEKSALQDRIKSEKVRAVQLKRAGKQDEALDALRKAKQLEKKLQALSS